MIGMGITPEGVGSVLGSLYVMSLIERYVGNHTLTL